MSATSSPAGSNQGSAIRSARLAASIDPCSGWWAKAAAFTRITSSASVSRYPRIVTPSASGIATSDASRVITHSARVAENPNRRASAAAAGWSACDHAVTSAGASVNAASASARPSP